MSQMASDMELAAIMKELRGWQIVNEKTQTKTVNSDSNELNWQSRFKEVEYENGWEPCLQSDVGRSRGALSQLCTFTMGCVSIGWVSRMSRGAPVALQPPKGEVEVPPTRHWRPIHSQTGEKGPTRDDPVHFDQRTWWKWCSMRTMRRS